MINVKDIKFKPNIDIGKDLSLEVGIIKDSQGKRPKSKNEGLKNFGGVKVRKINTSKTASAKISEVAEFNEKRYKFMSKPLNQNKFDLDRIVKDLFNEYLVSGKGLNRVLNGTRAIVRQPMFKGIYKNKASTAKTKGFNRGTIDTGQLYNSIDAILINNNKIIKRS